MSDLLEEAKDFFGDGYGRPEKPLIQRLIVEVGRLEGDAGLLEASRSVCRELNEEIESLTKERDELKERLNEKG